ncbi:MAG: hypothetical protein DSZ28_06825 [Thiothrix sp.]|nr:MAG: hypothetical protein DSZ28_06825 [Thiothrix sp.]
MAKHKPRIKHLSIISVLAVIASLWLPLVVSAATVAYSTDFSKTVNLVVQDNSNPIKLNSLELQRHEPPYNQSISAEIPAVFQQGNHPNASYTKDGRFPTGLWLLGSALIAMVGYKRMRNPND